MTYQLPPDQLERQRRIVDEILASGMTYEHKATRLRARRDSGDISFDLWRDADMGLLIGWRMMPPAADSALTFDEVEALGLDGSLRDIGGAK